MTDKTAIEQALDNIKKAQAELTGEGVPEFCDNIDDAYNYLDDAIDALLAKQDTEKTTETVDTKWLEDMKKTPQDVEEKHCACEGTKWQHWRHGFNEAIDAVIERMGGN